MKQWIIKNFKRKRAVIIHLVHEDGHFTKHWCLPFKDNIVKITDTENAVVIDRTSMMLSTKWNVPTYVVHYSNCEVMLLSDLRERMYSSAELKTIVDNNEIEKAYKATKGDKLSNEGMIILAFVVLGFIASIYFNYMKFDDLQKSLTPDPTPIVEVVEEG